MNRMEDLKQELRAVLASERSRLLELEPMSRHTTFRIGGPAALYAVPDGEEELAAVLRLCGRRGVPCRILGNGSNLLVSDRGVDGVVVAMEDNWNYGEVLDGARPVSYTHLVVVVESSGPVVVVLHHAADRDRDSQAV